MERRPLDEEEIRKIVDSAQRKRGSAGGDNRGRGRKPKAEEERNTASPGLAQPTTGITPPPQQNPAMYPPGQHPFYAQRPVMFPGAPGMPGQAGQPRQPMPGQQVNEISDQ